MLFKPFHLVSVQGNGFNSILISNLFPAYFKGPVIIKKSLFQGKFSPYRELNCNLFYWTFVRWQMSFLDPMVSDGVIFLSIWPIDRSLQILVTCELLQYITIIERNMLVLSICHSYILSIFRVIVESYFALEYYKLYRFRY